MFVDAREVESGASFRSDVCIVGAGAAGITIALELAASGLDVTLVESGSHESEAETQRLYTGRNLGIRYPLWTSRLRFFGGSTNHWGGLCRRLEPADFEPRPWIEGSGWPITLSELEPFYERARRVLDLPELSDRPDALKQPAAAQSPLLRFQGAAFDPILWQRSARTKMGERYRGAIAESERITCVLNANVTELVPNGDRRAIDRVRARTLGGRELDFRSRDTLLAAGGIENARILLLSDARVPGGIGNQHDLVGRYFAEHLNRSVAELVMTFEGPGDPDAGGYFASVQDGVNEVGLVPAARLREEDALLGCAIVALGRSSAEEGSEDAAIRELLSGAEAGRAARTHRIVLGALAEQAPNRNSRVVLTSARDALGLRKVALDWRIADQDLRSLRTTVERFAAQAGRTGSARVRLRDLDEGPWIVLAGHHMGTTRMADDPKRGVTDRNGRVYGMANLFVAGSSLFPTSSFVNPTLTIVALAIAQADLLKQRA